MGKAIVEVSIMELAAALKEGYSFKVNKGLPKNSVIYGWGAKEDNITLEIYVESPDYPDGPVPIQEEVVLVTTGWAPN